MTDLDVRNTSLKSEADIILYQLGLWEVLARYGTPSIQGSYAMDAMVCPDLDVHVVCDAPSPGAFFDLAKEIEDCLQAPWMKYLNNFSGEWAPLPLGLYWGVQTSHNLPRLWNIDIWCMDPAEARERSAIQADLQARMTPEYRQIILQIKSHFCSHPKYGRGFAGFDIYKAVLDDGLQSVAEFEAVLREKGLGD